MPKPNPAVSHNDAATIRLYWNATMKHRTSALLSLGNPIGAMLNSVLVPLFASRSLAHLASHTPGAERNLGYMAIAAAVGIIANRVGFVHLMRIQAIVLGEIHEMLYTRLLARSTSFHNNQVSGKLVSDAIDFVTSYLTLSNVAVNTGVPFLLVILAGLTVVFLSSPILGLYILVVMAVTLIWAYVESRRRFDTRNRRLAAQKRLTAHLADTIVNTQTVKTFARESYEQHTNQSLSHTLRDLRLADWQTTARTGNNRMSLLLVSQLVLLLIVARLSTTNPDILGTGFFAFTYVFVITYRLFDLNTMTRQIEESLLNASPMTQMLAEPIEITDAPGAPNLKVTKGAIVWNDVHFHYQDTSTDQTVFAGLDIQIKPGERVGLVGPSGGGKSTLTRLLLRFEDLDAGTITIDGQDIAAVKQTSLRQAIAYVPQEPLLFHRSIRDNIAYGRPSASNREIEASARKAHADEFIAGLPKGINTVVGERGVKLSGGQRQRVAIARAILKDAPILMLDEATSALDSESEVMIQKALWELMKGRTAIVIAHRLSTIQRMDRIIVLDEGKIVEQGTHAELLKHGGLYAKLWGHQSGGFLAAGATTSGA